MIFTKHVLYGFSLFLFAILTAKTPMSSQIIVFEKYQITDVIHLAAESHVDRSIEGPMEFAMTNVIGTLNLLNEAKAYWNLTENLAH